MRPAKRDIDPDAASHAGRHGDFEVVWCQVGVDVDGWYVAYRQQQVIGPFHTSQAAFGAVKDAIDELITEEMRTCLRN
jgi:hypothetical protein